ncbi:MAG: MFS transporter [Leucobacter sp.]
MSSSSETLLEQSAPAPAVALTRRQVAILITLLGLANFGVLMAVTTPQYISLAMKLSVIAPETATTELSLLLAVGVAVQIVMLLLVGRLSDYTSAKIGMRRPWLIGGVIALSIGCVLMSLATSLPVLWAGYLALSMGATSCIACLYATIPDQVPERRRGLATGVIGGASAVGSIAGLFIVQLAPDNAFLVYVAPAVCAVVGVLAFTCYLKDRRLTERRPVTVRTVLGAFSLNGRKSPSLAWFVPSIALVNTTVAAVVSYAYFFLGAGFGVAWEELPLVMFFLQLVFNGIALLVNFVVGPLTDRIGRRRPFYAVAVVLFVLGIAALVIGGSLVMAFVGFALIGAGQGLVLCTYLSIAVDAMADLSTSARDINVIAGCYTLPYAFLPLIAPLLLGADGMDFTALLVAAGVITLASLIFLPKVKVR